MLTLPGPLQVVQRLRGAFDAPGIVYLLGGGLVASSALGMQRKAQDMDFVVERTEVQVGSLAAALADDFCADADRMRAALQTESSFHVIHLPTRTKADLFVRPEIPFARSERAQRVSPSVG